MPLSFGFAVAAIGKPIAIFLLKRFLGEFAAAGGEGLLEIAAAAIGDEADRHAAKHQFEQLGERIVRRLRPLFEKIPDNSANAIAGELGATLSQSLSTDLLLDNDLDPAKLASAFRKGRALPHAMFSADETALYERALDHTARYLVGVAQELPHFEPKAVGAVLGRLRRMDDQLEKTIDGVARIERAIISGRNDAAAREQRFEADYREAVARKLDYLELFGADVSDEARHHKLSVGYVSLTVSASGSTEISGTVSAERMFAILATGTGRLLIRGEAGSGKSTLVRWLAIQAASAHGPAPSIAAWASTLLPELDPARRARPFERTLPRLQTKKPDTLLERHKETGDPAARPTNIGESSAKLGTWLDLRLAFPNVFLSTLAANRIPFVVRLRDCREGRFPAPEDLPGQIAAEIGRPPEAWIRSVLDDGRAFLLLDGVDEVPNNRRSQIRAAIRGIAKLYAKSWIVVTTRPTAVAEGWLRADGFAEAEINPLSEPDRAELIRRWHQAVAEELRLQGRPQDLSLLADNLIAELSGAPALARLAANPLLCAVICALHRDRREVLPQSQGELCEAICSLLLHRREAEAGLSLAEFPAEYRALGYKQKRAILQSIAHHMADNQESSITEAAAIDRTRAALRRFPGADEGDAPVVTKALVERSGMLRERRAGSIDFTHNTLRDYLAAEIFVEDGDVPKLARNAADDAWRQVVRFAAASDNRRFATELIERILAEADRAAPAPARRLRVAALDCRYAALNLDAATVGRVNAVESGLVPPQTMEDAEALAAGGNAVVPLLRYRTMRPECAAASVRALRLIGTPQARQMLTEYYGERRAPVIDELCQAVNPLLLDYVREQLATSGGFQDAVARQITDLGPLGGMTGLERLDLSGCTAIRDLSPIRTLQNLKSLILPDARISDLSPVTALPSLQSLALHAPAAKDLALLNSCPALTQLRLWKLTDAAVTSLILLSRLEDLNIEDSSLSDWPALARLTSLRSLGIARSNLGTVEWLRGLAQLTLLVLECNLEDPGPIADLPNLERLALVGNSHQRLPAFPPDARLARLIALDTAISDLAPLGNLANLQWLNVSGSNVADLGPIAHMKQLRRLDLSGTRVTDLEPIANLELMTDLNIAGTAITSLRSLRDLVSLRTLTLSTLDHTSLAELLPLPHLQEVVVGSVVAPELREPLEARGVTVTAPPGLKSRAGSL